MSFSNIFLCISLLFFNFTNAEITSRNGDFTLEILPHANPYILKKVTESLNLTCHIINHGNIILSGNGHNLTWRLPLNSKNSKNRIMSYNGPDGFSGLLFQALQESDSGDYTCQNEELGLAASARLTVKPITQNKYKKPYCGDKMFVCPNGNCIIEHYVCDGRPDCKSGEDEDVIHCGNNPCQGKLPCEDGRCIPIEWCCDMYHDPNCTVVVQPGCCRQLSMPFQEHDTIFYPEDDKHISDMGFLQTTIYTIIACALAFMIIVLLLISAICKVHIRRNHCPNHMHQNHPLSRHRLDRGVINSRNLPLDRSFPGNNGNRRRNFYFPGNLFSGNRRNRTGCCNCRNNVGSFNQFMNRYDQVPSYDAEFCSNENCVNFNDMIEMQTIGSNERNFELQENFCDNNRLNINENNSILNRILFRLRGLNFINNRQRDGADNVRSNLSTSNRFLTPILQRVHPNNSAPNDSPVSTSCLTVNYNINSGIQILGDSLSDTRLDLNRINRGRNFPLLPNCAVHGATTETNRSFHFVGRPVAPPPYSEMLEIPPKIGPPPPYVSVENLIPLIDQLASTSAPVNQQPENGAVATASTSTETHSLQSDNCIGSANLVDHTTTTLNVQSPENENNCNDKCDTSLNNLDEESKNKGTPCIPSSSNEISVSPQSIDLTKPGTSGVSIHKDLISQLEDINYIDSESDISDNEIQESKLFLPKSIPKDETNEILSNLTQIDQNLGSLTTLDRFFPDDNLKQRKKPILNLLNLDRTAQRNDIRNKPAIKEGNKKNTSEDNGTPDLTIRHSLGDLSPIGQENRTLFEHDLNNISNNLRMSDRFLTLPLRESFIGLRKES